MQHAHIRTKTGGNYLVRDVVVIGHDIYHVAGPAYSKVYVAPSDNVVVCSKKCKGL